MGTPEQRAHRQAAAARQELIDQAKARGQIRNDQDLRNFISSIGGNPEGPQYKQNYSQGGYSLYGPSWDPGWNFDFNENKKIPWQGAGEDWYDPSKAENWQNTDPLQAIRMRQFYDWRDKNGEMIDRDWGGNASAAWYALRAKSGKPNQGGMRWWDNSTNAPIPPTAAAPASAPAAVAPNNVGLPTRPPTAMPAQSATAPPARAPSGNASPYGVLNPATARPMVSKRPTVPWSTTWRY